jgi:aminoglycoside phosphotransferase (APT) family kinase protein
VLTDRELLDRLRAYIDGGERITGIRPLSFGHSNRTWLLEGLDRVLRMPPAGRGLLPPYDMAHQHRVLAGVVAQPGAPPVPAVYDLCTDPEVAGAPFFVMERRPGASTDWKAPPWLVTGGPPLRERLSRLWIGAVCAVHALPPDAIAAPVRTPAEEAAYWLRVTVDSAGPDRLRALLEDLVDDPPPSSGPLACVHGDTKFGNFLWHRGDLSAVVDWEMACVGDPLTDIGYLLGLWPAREGEPGQMPFTQLAGWWSRGRIVEEWERRTGRSAEGVDRHEQLGMAKIGAVFAAGIHLYRTGGSADPRLARWPRSLETWLDLAASRRAVSARRA